MKPRSEKKESMAKYVKVCQKNVGPPTKLKYISKPIEDKYREGKLKKSIMYEKLN